MARQPQDASDCHPIGRTKRNMSTALSNSRLRKVSRGLIASLLADLIPTKKAPSNSYCSSLLPSIPGSGDADRPINPSTRLMRLSYQGMIPLINHVAR